MPAQTAGPLADQLRDAIARRAALQPGTSAHWRAVCDVKALQRALVASLGTRDAVVRSPTTSRDG